MLRIVDYVPVAILLWKKMEQNSIRMEREREREQIQNLGTSPNCQHHCTKCALELLIFKHTSFSGLSHPTVTSFAKWISLHLSDLLKAGSSIGSLFVL